MAAQTIEEKIAFIKLRIGDTPNNPLYPMFSDEEYTMVLATVDGNVDRATRIMAISATMVIGSMSTREHIGDLTIENSFSTNYLKAMDYLINDPVARIPLNLMPWVAGENACPTKLMQVADLSCKGQACKSSACGC